VIVLFGLLILYYDIDILFFLAVELKQKKEGSNLDRIDIASIYKLALMSLYPQTKRKLLT
jgi:hypothetical protein